MTLPGPLYTSANFRTHDSTPETLMPEGNKSMVSGGGADSICPHRKPRHAECSWLLLRPGDRACP